MDRMTAPSVARPTSAQTAEARFWAKVTKDGACWLWQGSLSGSLDYGQVRIESLRVLRPAEQRGDLLPSIVSVRVSGPLLTKLHRLAAGDGVSPSELIRRAIEFYDLRGRS